MRAVACCLACVRAGGRRACVRADACCLALGGEVGDEGARLLVPHNGPDRHLPHERRGGVWMSEAVGGCMDTEVMGVERGCRGGEMEPWMSMCVWGGIAWKSERERGCLGRGGGSVDV